ncbi:MAG: hypothetical protein MJA84_15130 [Firmicutes bacterium]|nr:hypothetical protein [Bacillota bacterium]
MDLISLIIVITIFICSILAAVRTGEILKDLKVIKKALNIKDKNKIDGLMEEAESKKEETPKEN